MILSPCKTIVSCGVPKSGSTWISNIMTDLYHVRHFSIRRGTPSFRGDSYTGFELILIRLLESFRKILIFHDHVLPMKRHNTHYVFIHRDIRDSVISRLFFYSNMNNNFRHLKSKYKTIDDNNINSLITSIINSGVLKLHKDVVRKVVAMSEVYVTTYEMMLRDAHTEIKRLVEFTGIQKTENEITDAIENNSFRRLSEGRKRGDEERSSFYRKGIAGDWKNYFTDEHKDLFKKLHGDFLIELKYENNYNW